VQNPRFPLSRGTRDSISYLEIPRSDLPAGVVEISLSPSNNVSWWKEIKAFDATGSMIAWVVASRDGQNIGATMQLRTTQADALVFSKAGLFGVPKMYDLRGLGSKGASRSSSTWSETLDPVPVSPDGVVRRHGIGRSPTPA